MNVTTATHCPYCALQCGMRLTDDPRGPRVSGDDEFPVNRGALCIKGWTSPDTLAHEERLTTPLARDERGVLVPVSWDEALGRVARAFRETQERHGNDAVGVFGGGSLTNEKAYLLGKLARVALGTANIDYNGRFCMSSAAAAANKALGVDRGLPFPVDDIARAECVLVVGGNPAETMPPLMRYFDTQRAHGGTLIVADPRASLTARAATLHLRLRPGTDAALANGILHVLVKDGAVDASYIDTRTEGFADVRRVVAGYWPDRVERITGVAEADIVEAARLLGRAKTAIVLTSRGAEQQAHGVANTLAFLNIALALGMVGKKYGGFGAVTGQGNGQGGREHGQKADQLPGYRKIDDPASRRHVANVWRVDEAAIPRAGLSAYEMLDEAGKRVRAMLVLGSNVVVSAPHAIHVEERLRALDFLVVSDFFVSETAGLAHVVLPSAQWAEEEGTVTNLEGRVLHRRRIFAPPSGVRTDLETMCELAQRLGKGHLFRYQGPRDVFDELRRASAGGIADYSGITYEKIDEARGVFWPCPSVDHPGTARLFEDGFPTPSGRARFFAAPHVPSAEEPDDDYPFHLTTGRVLAQYQSGTQTRRVKSLVEMTPEPLAELHPSAAARLGLKDGDRARLSTRRGSCDFKLRVTATIRDDTIFVPFHWGGALAANRLTNPALDPVSRMPELKVCAVRIDAISEGER